MKRKKVDIFIGLFKEKIMLIIAWNYLWDELAPFNRSSGSFQLCISKTTFIIPALSLHSLGYFSSLLGALMINELTVLLFSPCRSI